MQYCTAVFLRRVLSVTIQVYCLSNSNFRIQRFASFIRLSIDVRRLDGRRPSCDTVMSEIVIATSNTADKAGRVDGQPPIYVLIAFVYSAVASCAVWSASEIIQWSSSSSCNNRRRWSVVYVEFPTDGEWESSLSTSCCNEHYTWRHHRTRLTTDGVINWEIALPPCCRYGYTVVGHLCDVQ